MEVVDARRVDSEEAVSCSEHRVGVDQCASAVVHVVEPDGDHRGELVQPRLCAVDDAPTGTGQGRAGAEQESQGEQDAPHAARMDKRP